MAKYPKKPSKPKSKTVASLESYLKRFAEWKKKCSSIDSQKKKLETLKKRVNACK